MEEKKESDVDSIGTRYRHFKGSVYQIVGFAVHSEDLGKLILYRKVSEEGELYGDTWARPVGLFFGVKEFENGEQVRRFEPI